MNNPLVSVIIPTKNSSKTLEACLKSIKEQSYKNIEIIVVDNNSSDNTKEISKKYTDKVFDKGPERSAQVNYGVEQSKGEFVYKVDSDFVLDKEVIYECIDKAKEGFEAVVVHNSPDVKVGWIAKIRKFEVDMYKYDITHSSARFVKKDIYKKIGGFNEKITAGEDYDFQNKLNRIGIKTGFINSEALHLGEPTHILPHMIKYFEYGKDFVNYKKVNEEESKKQLGFIRPVYIKNWNKFISNPILGIEFIIYNFLKFGFGAMGYVSNLFNKPRFEKNKIRFFISPHYDDAIFSLGGYISMFPKDSYIITVFGGAPNSLIQTNSWWDTKCGFDSPLDSIKTRKKENILAAHSLLLKNESIIDLNFIDKQYRSENSDTIAEEKIISEELESVIKKVISLYPSVRYDLEIYGPFYDFHPDHKITKKVIEKIVFKIKGLSTYFYEDIPYVFLPKRIFKKNKQENKKYKYNVIFLNRKQFLNKIRAMSMYKSQFKGNASRLIFIYLIYAKFKSIRHGKIFSYCELVYCNI